ncbi:MAG: hypothetical protein MZV63_42760 [Marinilabiliales bacterium]|nr:hypothetical protein [Marinilabiliales bacterium]
MNGFFDEAVSNGWITTDTLLNNACSIQSARTDKPQGQYRTLPGPAHRPYQLTAVTRRRSHHT